MKFASFWDRAFARIIDYFLFIFPISPVVFVLLGILVGALRIEFDKALLPRAVYIIDILIYYFYFVFSNVRLGGTLGKKIMKIRVQDINTGKNLTWSKSLLRETVGKLLSTVLLQYGYFKMIWDPKKQTIHDSISGSVVVKTK